ncbi:probable serine hydrolase [Diorhabda carinulata]|uniref:probable serine hydrolase n=1 Tax=Diorhabda carinulata TaxID=1163345 RepID=UPI0025A29DB7|nr:probable serine hydrolase [Diorhabda carinulata]
MSFRKTIFINSTSRPKIYYASIRKVSSVKRQFKEVEIRVPWGFVAGKWWEPYDVRPILALHGWQDNCQTFDRLIPLLNNNVGFLAIDLPGHGYSSHLPHGMVYFALHYVMVIKSISRDFNWSKVSLLGHSLGAITSFLYSTLFPAEVDFLMCLDAVKPMATPHRYKYLSKSIEAFFKYNEFVNNSTEPPSYTIEEIEALVAKPNKNSIDLQYTKYIYERNIAPSKLHPGKYYFTRDPRLKIGNLNTINQRDIVEISQQLTMPIFIAKSKTSSYYEPKENYYEIVDILKRVSADCDFNYVDGTHHFHLNNPECVASIMTNFIRRHNTEDRNIGGIKKDVVVDRI